MASAFRRRLLFIVYIAAIILLSCWILRGALAPGRMVQIHDQETVMRRHTNGILTQLTVSAPPWNTVRVTEREFLFALSQQMDLIPQAMDAAAQQEPGGLTGVMIFADGDRVAYSVGNVLTRGNMVYYSHDSEPDLAALRRSLAALIYTPGNLAAFFEEPNLVSVTDGLAARELGPEAMELLRQAVTAGEMVEDPEDAAQTLAGREPRYVLQILDEQGGGLLRLDVHANESTLVYDPTAPGQPPLLCFSGRMLPLCEGFFQDGGA